MLNRTEACELIVWGPGEEADAPYCQKIAAIENTGGDPEKDLVELRIPDMPHVRKGSELFINLRKADVRRLLK